MNPRKLPCDVLLTIASFADRQGVLALLATCRGLHNDCSKYALKGTVKLGSDQQILSFLEFMRPHSYKRWRHLVSLCILQVDEPISPQVAEELVKAIPRALRLESLQLEDAEKTLRSHPDLPLAFVALPNIKHIVVRRGRRLACAMMESMHWPLESAFLGHSGSVYDPSDPPDIELRMHPAAMLRNCCATLKTLECDTWDGFNCVLTAGTYPVYPQLESLHINNLTCINSAPWVISYPNLKHLSVKTTCSHMVDTGLLNSDSFSVTLSDARSFNLDAHRTQEQKWQELEMLVGTDVVDLYLRGFPCHIREIAFSLHPLSLRFFGPVVATARPARLRLSIPTELFDEPIPTYLDDPALTDLESLVLDVEVWIGGWRGGDGDTDVDGFLGYVFSALRRVSAREFILFLKVGRSEEFPWSSKSDNALEVVDAQDDGSVDSEEDDLCEVEIWANDVDLDALMHRFFGEVPSLESVELSIGPPEGDSTKYAQSSRRQLSTTN